MGTRWPAGPPPPGSSSTSPHGPGGGRRRGGNRWRRGTTRRGRRRAGRARLTIPAGCGPSAGIAGLTLGGGLGVPGRAHGLTCDHLPRAQVVLADGRVVAGDQHHDQALFWALRGAGGGHLGGVTSLVSGTLPAPAATVFQLAWPLAHAAVVGAWQARAPPRPTRWTPPRG